MTSKSARLAAALAIALSFGFLIWISAAETEGPRDPGKRGDRGPGREQARVDKPAPGETPAPAVDPAKPYPGAEAAKPALPAKPGDGGRLEMARRAIGEQAMQRVRMERELAQAKARIAEGRERLAQTMVNNPTDKEAIEKAVRSLSDVIANSIRQELSVHERFLQQPSREGWGRGQGRAEQGAGEPGGERLAPSEIRRRIEQRIEQMRKEPRKAGEGFRRFGGEAQGWGHGAPWMRNLKPDMRERMFQGRGQFGGWGCPGPGACFRGEGKCPGCFGPGRGGPAVKGPGEEHGIRGEGGPKEGAMERHGGPRLEPKGPDV